MISMRTRRRTWNYERQRLPNRTLLSEEAVRLLARSICLNIRRASHSIDRKNRLLQANDMPMNEDHTDCRDCDVSRREGVQERKAEGLDRRRERWSECGWLPRNQNNTANPMGWRCLALCLRARSASDVRPRPGTSCAIGEAYRQAPGHGGQAASAQPRLFSRIVSRGVM